MRRLLLILLCTTTLSAAEVRVFAAASLIDALQEVAAGYERTSGERIVFNFAGSSTLARQIENGAPADLFLSADERTVDTLARQRLVARRASLLSNTLVVVVHSDDRRTVRSARDLAQFHSIAIAEPSTVPAGIYARGWLERQHMWTPLRARVIPTDNVRAALAAVDAGNADAAIVYRTDARAGRRVRIAFEVPPHDAPPISYGLALLRDAEQPKAARRFFDHLLHSSAARAVFARHGFALK